MYVLLPACALRAHRTRFVVKSWFPCERNLPKRDFSNRRTSELFRTSERVRCTERSESIYGWSGSLITGRQQLRVKWDKGRDKAGMGWGLSSLGSKKVSLTTFATSSEVDVGDQSTPSHDLPHGNGCNFGRQSQREALLHASKSIELKMTKV